MSSTFLDFILIKPYSRLNIKKGIFFFFLFKATPVAYGSSLARGQVRIAAVAYTTGTVTLDL